MKRQEIRWAVAVYVLLCWGGLARGGQVDWMDVTWQAICWVESQNNPHAYHAAEDAAGIAQIRPGYLWDVNEYLGSPVFGLVVLLPPRKVAFLRLTAVFGRVNSAEMEVRSDISATWIS